ncbi:MULTISPECIES: transglutaminase-like cysteine peptidase [unclassified Neorhizobium]|uniref:transglutaminase-like cysteine peptidase n=1 Tax=unclassified Neorhizobium TaxID=2629175 RepID=UPI001FF2B13D|nr:MULTISPECIES: transglutaminase-like cysteine peptidase [unclassified Neorhizobium]MCJ9670457.1 transglutaminase-like cysteine peptidase [Neorhizobium sp. SHOUNA12B]MCJ9744338.1 transglutaminase-like cysteine peptidase [Neorhizobium sp. SHOUNA12A]
MANKKNTLKAAVVATLVLPFIASTALSAPMNKQQFQINTGSTVSIIGSHFLEYLPKPLSIMASLAFGNVQVAAAFQTFSELGSKIALPAARPANVTEVAIKPADLYPSRRVEPAPSNGAVFDTVAIPFKRLAALKKLAPALEEMDNGTAVKCNGKGCSPAFAAIQLVGMNTSQSSLRDKLNAVNAAVNQSIRYRTDQDAYKVADRWSTPQETLSLQQGDCEDFAILKMAALRAEGIDPNQMSIVVLFDQKRHFYHAILSVEAGGKFFILDNMRNQVLLDTQLPDYMPLYSIKGGKGFLHGSRRKDQNVAMVTPLEKIAPGEGANF